MKEPVLNTLLIPSLEEPILIVGLQGLGDVGRLVAQKIIDSSDAKLFAELYSPHFPDIVIAEESGICHLPRYEFWACTSSDPNFIVLTGDFQPIPDEVTAYYEVSSMVLELAKRLGSKWVVTIGGYRGPPEKVGKIYVSSTSREITTSLMSYGAAMYRGRIVGMAGLILGLGGVLGLKGACILGVTSGIAPDDVTATNVYAFLSELLKSKIFS